MKHENLFEALGIIYDSVKDEKIIWRVNGSFNLLLHEIDIDVHDLDIETDEKGIGIFREKLKEFILDDRYKKDIKSHSLMLNIEGVEVEILAHDNHLLAMFDKIIYIKNDQMEIPAISLEDLKTFYKMTGNEEKVALISNHQELIKSLDV